MINYTQKRIYTMIEEVINKLEYHDYPETKWVWKQKVC